METCMMETRMMETRVMETRVMEIDITVNGELRHVEVDGDMRLIDLLLEDLATGYIPAADHSLYVAGGILNYGHRSLRLDYFRVKRI